MVFDTLFPKEVVTIAMTLDDNILDQTLYPEELGHINKAVKKRKREFIAGRVCAKMALKQLGITQFPLLVGKSREPLWPSNVVGSLSHCDDYCGVAIALNTHLKGVGLDIEHNTPLEKDIIDTICTPSEQSWIRNNQPLQGSNWPKIMFSAKESVYKCLFPIFRIYIGFLDVEIRIKPETMQFSALLGKKRLPQYAAHPPLTGHIVYNSQHIFTGVAIEAQ